MLRVDDAVLVAVDGDLDVAATARFAAAVEGLADVSAPPDVTVDLSRLEFIDAAGIAALVRLRNAVHHVGGDLRVRSPSPHVRRVLKLSSVVDLLDLGSAPN